MYLMTHSLLSAWKRLYEVPKNDNMTDGMPDFMKVLRRERSEPSPAMQSGIDFEDLVTAILQGKPQANYHVTHKDGTQSLKLYNIGEHPWYEAAAKVAGIVQGAKLQYVAKRSYEVNGMSFLLYGRLDALKAGQIFDIKYSGSYERGRFIDSTQHPMYMKLIPEAMNFTYIVSNGKDVWTEMYWWDQVPTENRIEIILPDFLNWLERQDLMDVYKNYWGAKDEG